LAAADTAASHIDDNQKVLILLAEVFHHLLAMIFALKHLKTSVFKDFPARHSLQPLDHPQMAMLGRHWKPRICSNAARDALMGLLTTTEAQQAGRNTGGRTNSGVPHRGCQQKLLVVARSPQL